jgi:GT2 family glycosyltransferase
MKLSAVILHFETPDETARSVAALSRSRRPADEILVVDNGSRAPLAGASLRAPKNLGFSGGCNLGIRRALDGGAELILLLNSDTEIAPDCLERLERALEPEVGIAGPKITDMSSRIESLGIHFSQRTGRMRNRTTPGPIDAVAGTCMLVRREVFSAIGLLDERFFYGFEDVDLCLRARARGFRTVIVPEAGVRHHLGRSIGRASPDRLYYAARNHLLAAELAFPLSPARDAAIVGWNLLHALFTAEPPRLAGLRAVAEGVVDHLRGRYGQR